MTGTARSKAIDAILARIRRTLDDVQEGFPHFAEAATGRWTTSPDGDWTGGFWVGQLWLAAASGSDPSFETAAGEWARRLQPRLESDTVFRGFLFWYGAAMGALLVGDEESRELARRGAEALGRSFSDAAGLFPLGTAAEEASDVGRTETNIDGVPGTVPLLAWASQYGAGELKPKAAEHTRRHQALLVRDDGSVIQSASLDPETGEPRRRYTHKGLTDRSTWARAQAWAMLGFGQAVHWLSPEFLDAATVVANWWLSNLPKDGVAFWDFDADDGVRDTSATAIAAAALFKIAAAAPSQAHEYRLTAEFMVDALVDRHFTGSDGTRPPGMLINGCYNRRLGLATNSELIWGDYFLFEALLALDDRVDTARL